MIKNPTVFVLGAGASSSYLYPTGSELRNHILQNLPRGGYSAPTELGNALAANGISPSEISEFRQALFYSASYTVDELLEHRNDLETVGKMAIAWGLSRWENMERLFEGNQNLYQHILGRMSCGLQDFPKNQVSFITFNYDRSLDVFLFEALKNRFGSENALKLYQEIPIIHVHGSLSALPWEDGGQKYSIPETGYSDLKAMAQHIKVVHEGQSRSAEFEKAQNLTMKARKVVFLGFGYHEVNVARLLDRVVTTAKFMGTSMNMNDREIAAAIAIFEKFEIQPDINPDHAKLDAFEYMNRIVRTD